MSKISASRIWVALLLSAVLAIESFAQFQVEDALDNLTVQYKNTQRNRSVSSLFCLDSMLRSFVDSAQRRLAFGEHAKHWKDEYSQLGLSIGHYSDQFQYSGRFLFEAHKLDPNSAYRSYTLYSEIVGIDDTDGLGRFPSIDVAFKYIKEFPRGPRAPDVLIIIGDFYKDLFMALRDGKEKADYHYDCLKDYMDSTSVSDQLSRAQKLSIHYYEQALILRPDDTSTKEILQEVRAGTVTSWSTCSD